MIFFDWNGSKPLSELNKTLLKPRAARYCFIYTYKYIYIYLSLRSNIDVLQICSLVNRIDDGTYSLPSVWVGWNLAITWYVIGAKKLRCASQIKHDKTMVNPGIVTMGIVTQENSLSIPISMGWLSRSHKTGVYMGIVTLLIYHISIYIYISRYQVTSIELCSKPCLFDHPWTGSPSLNQR